MSRKQLKVDLSTQARQEACLQTLALCTRITRDLIGDAQEMEGPIALAALAQVFDQMIADVVLASTPVRALGASKYDPWRFQVGAKNRMR